MYKYMYINIYIYYTHMYRCMDAHTNVCVYM